MIKYIIGGNLLLLWFLITIYSHNKLTDLTIRISERLRPRSWYNKSAKEWDQDAELLSLLWIAVVGGFGTWIAMVHAYPFIMSLWI